MTWTTPITDRTFEDVKYAFENQNLSTDLKGAWNVSDTTRIINNMLYLRNLIKQY